MSTGGTRDTNRAAGGTRCNERNFVTNECRLVELATRTEPQAERDCTCDVAVTVIAVSIAKWKQLVVEQRQAGRRCDGAKKTTGNSMTPTHYTPGRRQL
ncbi:hypothetical protein QE152_g25324 [Popillia japonica]|uniref:Uncharacterized protein n=1 Tax=Popillia japonica TaxID=7064 RepID=A0AAW1K0D9_POPJA